MGGREQPVTQRYEHLRQQIRAQIDQDNQHPAQHDTPALENPDDKRPVYEKAREQTQKLMERIIALEDQCGRPESDGEESGKDTMSV
eukprot:NODE_2704_length_453_cov_342.844059_g2239_i0.p1 GENE.NODE_2704_length_453_cov_342.844059_g2239_i0~~NODE_2704_length_453_cov_342.844059_g2239_i0.p1  ORF type:complete len:87 (-),score=9.20 NODE_2704_length_453_cov_342.844059_g2239_i0:161-421(-)